jgi:tripartite-type tricarboxylate transporter receptor subunit TctC
MAEAGMTDFDASLWFGLLTRAGTPQTAIAKVAKAAETAMSGAASHRNAEQPGLRAYERGSRPFRILSAQ